MDAITGANTKVEMVCFPKASEMPEYRPALSTDAEEILAVLEEVAPEVPLHLTPMIAAA